MASTKIISFWGKGGVGKTTLATATAIGLSRDHSVLLISTDPTPSIKKLLSIKGDDKEIKKINSNLSLLELEEEEVINLWRKRFGREVYEVISSFLPVEEDIIDYIAGAPGISDEFLMYYIMEEWKKGEYDIIVWDTVAAGGSIRLLRIEKEFYSHLGQAIQVYLKIKGVLEKLRRKQKEPIQLLQEWRRIAEEVLGMLSSSNHHLYLVSVPEPLGFHVTKSILKELELINVRPKKLVLNMIYDESICPGCLPLIEKSRLHKEYRELFYKEFSRLLPICEVPWSSSRLEGAWMLEQFYNNYLLNKCIGI